MICLNIKILWLQSVKVLLFTTCRPNCIQCNHTWIHDLHIPENIIKVHDQVSSVK